MSDQDDTTQDVTQRLRAAEDDAESGIERARESATEQVHRAQANAQDAVRRAEAKVREQVAQAQQLIGSAGLTEPTPATSVDEAQRQAADLRRAIDRDLDTLQSRLPQGEQLQQQVRTYGGAVLGALGVVAAASVARKQRRERKRVEREARAHAEAIARYLPFAADEPWDEPRRGKGGLVLLTLVAAAVGAFVVRRQRAASEPEPDLWGPPQEDPDLWGPG